MYTSFCAWSRRWPDFYLNSDLFQLYHNYNQIICRDFFLIFKEVDVFKVAVVAGVYCYSWKWKTKAKYGGGGIFFSKVCIILRLCMLGM